MPERENLHVTRKEPDLKTLQKRYRKEKDGEIVRRLSIIIQMLVIDNIAKVAQLTGASDDTIRRWVQIFNEGGLDALAKKNVPEDLRF